MADGRYWSGVSITALNAVYDGALTYGGASIGNVPQARLATAALIGLNILTDGTLGIGSGGVTGNWANGVAASGLARY